MIVLGFKFIALFLCVATPPESWTEQSRLEDEENFYYVGVSSPSRDDKSAINEALQMAIRSLTFEHFGQEVNVQERLVDAMDSAQLTGQMTFSAGKTHLRGLKIVDQKWSRQDGLGIVRVLVAYPRKEKEAELSRQKSNPEPSDEDSFNRFEGLTPSYVAPARLRVITEPPGAQVYLDEEMIGRSSLEAMISETGLMDLELSLKDHKTFKTKVMLNPGETSQVNITLSRAKGILDLRVDPPDAKVELVATGKRLDRGTSRFELPAGEHTISIKHPRYLTRIEEIYIEADVVSFREFRLEPKARERSVARTSLAPSAATTSAELTSDASPTGGRVGSVVKVAAIAALVGLVVYAGMQMQGSRGSESKSEPLNPPVSGGSIKLGGW